MHASRIRRDGTVGPANRKIRAEGEGSLHGGYLRVMDQGRRVLQHRLVMERLLGRPLHPEETVHHRDGDRLNNHPDNLELWVSRHAGGQRVDDLVAFIVERYPERVRSALNSVSEVGE